MVARVKRDIHPSSLIQRIIVSACAIACMCASGTGLEGKTVRPLFVQVHRTSHLEDMPIESLRRILCGGVIQLRAGYGKAKAAHIAVDSRIASSLRRVYPNCTFSETEPADDSLTTERRILYISDSRGLKPSFKLLPINKTLPWGRIQNDGSIQKGGDYPFFLEGAEAWDEEEHVCVVQTGVTAMTRAFIPAVDRSGDILSPIRDVRGITAGADLSLTSNEVSFLESCSYPLRNNMVFCTPLRFFRILKEAGFDVIELTGNHNNDFGREANRSTIRLLKDAGMVYYGGGLNRADAEAVRYVTIRGTRFAFVGFNECGPPIAWATDDAPGAARLTKEGFERAVAEASARAEAVFVAVQWCNENSPRPDPIQIAYFRRAARLGGTVMVSSSAHRPMGIEFYHGRFISYGLGNFLFDQMQSLNHRRGLIARHHFYRGRHVALELIPYLIHDYSRPTLLHGADARAVMDEVFRYSLGPVFSHTSSAVSSRRP